MILQSALICLASNVFFESRGEPIPGQYAVAQVTMRRAGNDPGKVCQVVHERGQFSWTTRKRSAPQALDPDAWTSSIKIARVVLSGSMPTDFSRGATHYHAVTVRPTWARYMVRTVQLHRHVFLQGSK
jgi:spore germination cell wall hydrolase CwlJ-like protein